MKKIDAAIMVLDTKITDLETYKPCFWEERVNDLRDVKELMVDIQMDKDE